MATYADGTTIAEAGDVVERIECAKPDDMVPVGRRFVVSAVHPACDDELYLEGVSLSWFSRYFKLISRAPSPAKSEPLVKWPDKDKPLYLKDIPKDEFFVVERCPQSVCIKMDGGCFYTVIGDPVRGVILDEPVRKVRLIREPKFEVI